MNTIVVFSTIVLLVLSSVFAAPSKPVSNNNPNKRIENLSKLVSSSPLIPLSDGNFTKFVINRPRQYYAVIMFTATNPKFQCNICLKSKALFEEAAKSYHDQNNVVTTDIDSRLFFFVLEVDNSRETFSDFQLETVPRIFILPPTTASTPKFNFHKYERENKVLLDGLPAFFDDIRDATGVEV